MLFELFVAGTNAIIDYISAHVLTCLIPAFFIAGAISALIPKERINELLGKKSPGYIAYPLAVIAGLLLAVCSCTILPLFAGIRKKGAGIGPALTFLYTAPATNLVAILFTGSVLGWDFALARIILSVIFAVLIGILISAMFKEDISEDNKIITPISLPPKAQKGKEISFFQKNRLVLFFIMLVGILIAGTRVEGSLKYIIISILVLVLIIVDIALFSADETKLWLSETWIFAKKIFPLLLAGIFIAGVLTAVLPSDFLAKYIGENTIFANFTAVLFGVVMYFPTLVEIPMANMFLSLGMAKGPLMAYLLADPVISLASILVVRKFIGTKRTMAYVGLIIVFATVSGLVFGAFAG